VPGALGKRPAPKPKANRCIGLANIALFEFIVTLVYYHEFKPWH
jgi:hypothetical protein